MTGRAGSPAVDFAVIGGGIVGVTLALEARRRHPDARVLLIEKEPECGRHASGRNSGVLHAGFYYTADSLKARFSREGNRELTHYCQERSLPIRACGKLVVARDEADLTGLDELRLRGRANGVELVEVSAAEAREIEPSARTYERALFSPTTSSVDPAEVMRSLVADAKAAGVEIRTGVAYLGRLEDGLRTSAGALSAGYVINAAGLYADKIARDFGFARNYRILPFRGLYVRSSSATTAPFRTHVYPVPDLRYPFLGEHVTVTADGRAKIGPTAVPALWREHYERVQNFRWREALEVGRLQADLFLRGGFDFRRLARREIAKLSRRRLLERASHLVTTDLRPRDWRWEKSGIRAQLVDTRLRRLEMDFRYEGDARSFHVLNAVSPAFTCALPFSRYLFDVIEGHLGHARSVPSRARATAPA